MAFTSGTATDYLDLLNRLKQFVTQDMLPANERWSVLRWVPSAAADGACKQAPKAQAPQPRPHSSAPTTQESPKAHQPSPPPTANTRTILLIAFRFSVASSSV